MADADDLEIRRETVEDVAAICRVHLRSWQASNRGPIRSGQALSAAVRRLH